MSVPDSARLAVRQRPPGPPVMYQTWSELLFLHWSFEPDLIQASLPEGLTVDTHGGRAWAGVVPFFMRNVRPRGLPAVPWLSHFLELNLRTYAVNADGVPGVWFYSLDCNRWPAVKVARGVFRLPYEHAEMSATLDSGRVRYRSVRRGETTPQRFEWRPRGETRTAEPGSLEFFLLERYALFAPAGEGRFRVGRVHHPPYEFSGADAPVWDAGLFALAGLPTPEGPPDHTAVCRGVDVEIFPLGPPA